MCVDKQKAILTDCLDLFVSEPFLCTTGERFDLAGAIIDTMGGYPRTNEASQPEEVGAYLYTSNARNSLKLARYGFVSYTIGFVSAQTEIEKALGLLTDNKG